MSEEEYTKFLPALAKARLPLVKEQDRRGDVPCVSGEEYTKFVQALARARRQLRWDSGRCCVMHVCCWERSPAFSVWHCRSAPCPLRQRV